MAGSREDCREYQDLAVERLVYCFAKDRRTDFHRTDLVDHHKPSGLDRLTNSADTDSFQRRKIESVFSYVMGRFEIDMGEYGFLAIEHHDLESGARATVADFLSVKTASASREIIHNPLDQCRLSAGGTTREQNFSITTRGNIEQIRHRVPYN